MELCNQDLKTKNKYSPTKLPTLLMISKCQQLQKLQNVSRALETFLVLQVFADMFRLVVH